MKGRSDAWRWTTAGFALLAGLLLALAFLTPGTSVLAAGGEAPGNTFRSVETTDGFELSVGWRDFDGTRLEASFPISRAALAAAEAEFGYAPAEMERELDVREAAPRRDMILRLRASLEADIKRSGYSDYMRIEDKDPLTFTLKVSAPPEARKDVKAAYDAVVARLAGEQQAELKALASERERMGRRYIEERGLRFIGDAIAVDYARIVSSNRDRLRHILEAIRDARQEASLRALLGVLLSFIQGIPYGTPPLEEDGKRILQFWVPPKVLVRNLGDCDSKAVAFAALWINVKKYPLLLIKVPGHMFIGLAVPGLGDEVVINGVRYTLCEVAGPEPVPPGMISAASRLYLEAGRYQYEIIRD